MIAPQARIDERKLQTVPVWGHHFSIAGKPYKYVLVGAPPSAKTTTAIPALIVPIRLSVPDAGAVFDATPIVPHILGSPLFAKSPANGNLQFADAMLRAEFPKARPGWHTLLAPSIGPTIEVAAPPGTVEITEAASGNLFGYIRDSSIVNKPIGRFMRENPQPGAIMIFITYNSVESFAFGYHSWKWGDDAHGSALVYMYSSWLEGVDDAPGFPAPDAATLSHEIAETIHDPLINSVTLRWGDHFRRNKCFDTLIEVADAVEDAPLRLVYYKELGFSEGRPYLFTLQNSALLPWFTREQPSSARGGAYSFPSPLPLHKPAPLACVE